MSYKFIDSYRTTHGVEPICKVLQIAPSGYWRHAQCQRQPQRCCKRIRRDAILSIEIQRLWHTNWQVYGARKVWRQLKRKGIDAARCTVELLMKKLGLYGVRRGKTTRTTLPDM